MSATGDGFPHLDTWIAANYPDTYPQHEDLCYVALSEAGPFKVGRTTDILSRIPALHTASAYELKVVALLLNGREVEREIHEQLTSAGYHMRGEWFSSDGYYRLGQYLYDCDWMVWGHNPFLAFVDTYGEARDLLEEATSGAFGRHAKVLAKEVRRLHAGQAWGGLTLLAPDSGASA